MNAPNDVHVQVIESNLNLRSLLSWNLQQAGYKVQQCTDIVSARDGFQAHQPSLVVLEAEFANGQGLQLCQWLRHQGHPLILMLSARIAETDVVTGLRAGADDYLKKPFGMQEFLARIESLARRSRHTATPLAIDFGDLHIDLVQRRVRYAGQFIDLTPQEFSLLYVLTQAEGEPLSRIDLLQRAWPDAIDNPRTVDTHVLSLRKKIELDPRHPDLIQTVRNVGYRICVGSSSDREGELAHESTRKREAHHQKVEAMAIASMGKQSRPA
ncbi:MAG: two-component system, OmpR family, response regulator [Phormidesmis priestleyi Ana]|uniref:Two-component system, OmpR family, response regulator n=1 Tax=Phormidesmis priestleyi Ana TaxID=1666911 RepID=A0A0N8KMP2_9CYAN|nr:MAG: two-component system, OmpR family, response regulator [Phormidesmis priestleyi Ana]